MSLSSAAPASSPATRTDASPRLKVRIGTALTGLVLIAVLATALIVHFSWMRTANRNVETVVGSINVQTAGAVKKELEATFRASEGAVEVIRSILFQGAIKADDEAKREFVFLSVLRSLPSVSWIGFGFPDGRFFGSHILGDDRIEMVEIGAPLANGARSLRRDRYRPIPGDIFFEERSKGESAYVTPGSKWYRGAMGGEGLVWTMVDLLPSGFEPAAVAATRFDLHNRFQGVIMVSLNLRRLADFLARLDVAQKGAAVIVSDSGTVVASSLADMRSASLLEAGDSAQIVNALNRANTGKAPEGMVTTNDGTVFYVTRTTLDFNGWALVTAIPRSAFTEEIDRNTRRLLSTLVLFALLTAGLAALFAHYSFVRPIQQVAGEIRHVESFALANVRHIATRLFELDSLSGALHRMAGSLKAFGLYVPADIVRSLIQQGVEPKPGGELREITVMFADLPGFTQLTEDHGPDVAPFLTEFLTLATKAIHEEGGIVDKFIGDCIMGIWNAPAANENHAFSACRAAETIRQAMQWVARPDGRKDGQFVRIGINSGIALVGNIGSSERLSYTAIGDVVNVASRLEALGKELNAEILISEDTRKLAGPAIVTRSHGAAPIKGRTSKVMVFELLRLAEKKSEEPGEIQHAAAG
ncbi:adenylate/guanylate cyclase domain-containing protein [Taklimakanibacter deserti]|uniref:adenylate/guanylate cyclase domain-containing protein n=1 Tax=Taklimakanibacter deserti TaxID=2267839 RepID=UPI0034D7AD3F